MSETPNLASGAGWAEKDEGLQHPGLHLGVSAPQDHSWSSPCSLCSSALVKFPHGHGGLLWGEKPPPASWPGAPLESLHLRFATCPSVQLPAGLSPASQGATLDPWPSATHPSPPTAGCQCPTCRQDQGGPERLSDLPRSPSQQVAGLGLSRLTTKPLAILEAEEFLHGYLWERCRISPGASLPEPDRVIPQRTGCRFTSLPPGAGPSVSTWWAVTAREA